MQIKKTGKETEINTNVGEEGGNKPRALYFDFPFFNVYITSLDSLCIDCKSPDIEQGQSPNSGAASFKGRI